MTSPAMQERREVAKAARRDAELAERFHDKQWHKRRRVQPKPLSLEQPTNTDHIALYYLEKGRSQERNAPKIAAAKARFDEQRMQIAAESAARHRGGRPKGSKTKAQQPGPVPSSPNFRCGHPRTPENTYARRRHSPATGLPLKGNTQCKACAAKHNKTRDRSRKTGVPSDVKHPYVA